MVTALVHSTQIAEPGDRVEEMKKQNMNLVKKLKKVIYFIILSNDPKHLRNLLLTRMTKRCNCFFM
jgi:hypothetical protein